MEKTNGMRRRLDRCHIGGRQKKQFKLKEKIEENMAHASHKHSTVVAFCVLLEKENKIKTSNVWRFVLVQIDKSLLKFSVNEQNDSKAREREEKRGL